MLMTLLVSVLTRMTAVTARSHCHHSCATRSMVACVAAGIILVLLPYCLVSHVHATVTVREWLQGPMAMGFAGWFHNKFWMVLKNSSFVAEVFKPLSYSTANLESL